MVCLTILSHALIAQSPSLASSGAQRLSRVVRALWWKPTDFTEGTLPAWDRRHVSGFRLVIGAQDTQKIINTRLHVSYDLFVVVVFYISLLFAHFLLNTRKYVLLFKATNGRSHFL